MTESKDLYHIHSALRELIMVSIPYDEDIRDVCYDALTAWLTRGTMESATGVHRVLAPHCPTGLLELLMSVVYERTAELEDHAIHPAILSRVM